MADSLLLGVDLGTSGVKVLLFAVGDTGQGLTLAETTVEYPLSSPFPGWSEQDPADWWRATATAIRQVLQRGGAQASRIEGLALSGQMHGATLLDAGGTVLRPCILWNDQRSAPQCTEIVERVGSEHLIQWVGNPALAGFTAPKLLWVREHEPEIYSRIATVLLPKDYINYRLTGALATEVSDASGTLLFDVANRRWSTEMLEALDLSASWLPQVHASTAVVGTISPQAARETGLLAGMPVVAGGADNACAAVGMGVVSPGQLLTSIGTSGTVVAPSDRLRLDPQARLHTFCHAVPDTWYLMGVVLSAGGSLRWFRDTLGGEEVRQARQQRLDPYELLMEEAGDITPGSDGLIFLPYLTGERTPHGDPNARGVFFGLSLRHTRAHMVRSVLEGITFALGDSLNIMRDLGISVGTVRATGGGARSELWRQMQADVLNADLVTALTDAGPAFGAAVLAGTGVGVFPSVQAATERLVQIRDRCSPHPTTASLYREYHDLYDSLYPALQPAFTAAAHLSA